MDETSHYNQKAEESQAKIVSNPVNTNTNVNTIPYSIYNISDEMPPPSPWHFIFTSYIPIWKFDEQSIIRINLTREKLSPYYFCHLLLIIAYVYYYKVLSKYIFVDNIKYQNITFYSLTFLFVMTNISYLTAHFTNPGILPYNWSTTKQRFYTNNELRDGFAINRNQKQWGKMHDWPPRSFFSGDLGVIVLRADHYCLWISHFIGLKNYKFFTQSLLYGTLFLLEYLTILYKVFRNPNASQFNRKYYFLILIGLSIILTYYHIIALISTVGRALFNFTTCEQLMELDRSFYNKGFIKNLEEVFGSIYLFPLWFLPVSIPLPVDGFNYEMRPEDICLFKYRSNAYICLST